MRVCHNSRVEREQLSLAIKSTFHTSSFIQLFSHVIKYIEVKYFSGERIHLAINNWNRTIWVGGDEKELNCELKVKVLNKKRKKEEI